MVVGTSSMGPPAVTPRKAPTTPSHSAFAFGATPHKTPLRTPGGSKIEQTSSTPIIDFHAIESQKENVQPLAKGRSAHALSNTLNMQHKQRHALLAQQRADHEATVTSADNADSDDPLEAWTKYVKWCIDNYPSGQTHESGIIPLLERATRHFKDAEQYTNDPRYLRLWILYARNVECARDVYNFLLANEIGTKLASLYEELAVVLEGQRMYDEADAMYKLGIARRANPIDRIKRRYDEYKTRIVLGHQAAADASGSAGSAAPALVVNYADALKAAMLTAGRSMLGQKEAAAGPARSHSANVLRGAGAAVGAIGASTPTPSTNNGRKLNVFHEDDTRSAAQAAARPHGASTKGWEDLGTVASRNQENIQADRMAGVSSFKIGAAGGVSKKPGSGLAVFRDSDDDDDDDQADVPATPKPAGVLSPKDHFAKLAGGLGRKPQSSETDLLRTNPFAYWDKDAKRVPDPASLRPESAGASSSRKVSSSSAGSQGERHRTKTTVSRSAQSSSQSGSSSSKARTQAAASSAGAKREKHAAPVADMYPAFRSDVHEAFYARHGWQSELTLEELMARARGYPALAEGWEAASPSAKPVSDPWTHLDALVGRWMPEDVSVERAASPEPAPSTSRMAELEPTETVAIDQATGVFPSRDVFDPDNSVANAVALNLRPGPKKKKKREGDTTTRTRMSPTLVTKATLLEVEGMFNGQDSSDDDSSDDDDDDDDDEDDDYLAPLSSVSRQAHLRIGLGSAADVPPTPTPASRSHGAATFAGQQDENAGVRATPSRTPAQAPRLGLGGATPMRTPLGARSAAPTALGAKPVYRESDDEDDEQHVEAQQPLQAGSPDRPAPAEQQVVAAVPATPMPSNRQSASRRWVEPMAEEEEEEEGEVDEVDENGERIEGEYNAGYEANEHLFRPQFQPLTPITEATYELTRYTNARTPATASRSAARPALKSWRSLSEDEEEDEEDEPRQLLTSGPLGARAARDEQLGADESQAAADERSFASTSGEEANRSAWTADNKADFELTKGLTIRCAVDEDAHDAGDFDDSLVIQDRASQHADAAVDEVEFTPPNPCSPVDPAVLDAILARLDEPIESQCGFVALGEATSDGLLAELQSRCKSSLASNQMTRKSMGGTVFHGTGMLSSPFRVQIGGDAFEIRGKLGEGGYGAVFLGYDVDSVATTATAKCDDADDDDDEDEEEEDRRKQVAIKVEAPANRWEFHILSQLQRRLSVEVQRSIIGARRLYCFSDASFLLLDLGEKGTLLDVVNHAVTAGVAAAGSAGVDTTSGGAGLDEVLAMFFVAELVRVVLGLHRAGVIHGDLKIDNCLLRLEDVSPAGAWSNLYARDGSAGWRSKGLTLIDFGRAIDTTAFPNARQSFIADWDTDARDCIEMRRGESFTYETDWFGIAAVAHCLLFGRYLDLKLDAHLYKLSTPMKRYWQSELWNHLFHICLNPKPRSQDGTPEPLDKHAVLEQLDTCLANMHAWLEANANKGGKNLKGLLRKLEIWAMKQGH